MKPEGSAVVTGASRGIGRAVAIELARRGFSVVATMRDTAAGAGLADEAPDAAGTIRVARLDVRDAGDFDFPDDLRVLVNNAGTRQPNLPIEEAPMSDWREVFETNVFGTVDMIRSAVPVLRRGHGGVICNVTSSSILSALPFFSTYRASKSAISSLNETLRVELAPFNIRVVEILPGPIDTEMFRTSVMFKVPEAAKFDAYRQVAEAHFPALKFLSEELITPPDRAAVAIVDAICDDGGPMRYGCDVMSAGALEQWRQASDEPPMQQAVAHFSPRAGTTS
jgi:NAD(P)-dependent dehydrogenase (short-subunit alcohol dehydrogenase family)